MRKTKLIFVLVITIFLLATPFKTTQANSQINEKNVLILMGPGYGLPTIDLFFPPLHEQLITNGLDRNNIHYEFLGLDRYHTDDAKLSILNYIETKYASVQLDLIVAASSDAAYFIVEYAANFKPDVPLLTSGFYFEPTWVGEPRQLIKIESEFMPIETLELAITLFPNSNHIFIVTGADVASQSIKNELVSAITQFQNYTQVEESTQMTHEEMLNHVSQLDEKTLVVFTSYFQDAANQNFVPAFVAKAVSIQSSVAVFGLRDVHIYNGNLSAGVATDTSTLGRQTADVVFSYFNGDINLNGKDVLITAEASTIINWSSLKRHGANLSEIPTDSIILNYELTTWEEHGELITQLILAFVVLLVFSVFTNILLIQNKKINKRYQTLGRGSLTVTWEIDRYGYFRYVSNEAQLVFGKNDKELSKNTKLVDLFDTDNHPLINDHLSSIKSNEKTNKEITSTSTIHDEKVTFSSFINPIFNKKGENIGYIGTTQNITERMQLEQNLKEAHQIAKLGRWELIHKEHRLVWSETIFDIFEIDSKRFETSYEGFLKAIHPDDRSTVDEAYKKSLVDKQPYSIEHRLLMEDGRIKWVSEKCNTEFDEKAQPIRSVGVVQDITERKQLEESVRFKTYHDELTGLPNRIYFEEQLKSLDKEENYPLLIAIADLDGLKIINDTYGIEVGDDVLKAFANILSGCNEKCFIARIAGDEFGLIYRQMTSERFEQIKIGIIQKATEIQVTNINVSITIGYDIKHSDSDDLRKVLINAENNMYSNSVLHGQSSRNETIMALFHALTEKYEEEKIHSDRVSMYCRLMGVKLNLRQDEVKELEFAGLMHDIGKITIPDVILDKPGKLTDEEWVVMKKHTINGYQILRSASKYSRLAEYALTHHERWDGKGYPNGLKGEDIPLFSRIISISDAYEAMTADRPYRKALDKKIAIEELYRCAGSQFDETLVEIFVKEVI